MTPDSARRDLLVCLAAAVVFAVCFVWAVTG